MEKCSWCGKEVEGQGVAHFEVGAIMASLGDGEVEICKGAKGSFCCHGCAWAYGLENESRYMSDIVEIMKHLIEDHGLVFPAGKAAGGQSQECCQRFKGMDESLAAWMRGERE